jgi:hypothetical protein
MLYVDHVQQLVVHLETVALHRHSYVIDLQLLLPVRCSCHGSIVYAV